MMARKRINIVMEEKNWERIKGIADKYNLSASGWLEATVMQHVEYSEAMIKRLEVATADDIYAMMKKLKGVL